MKCIDTNLLRLKFLLFTFYGALGCLLPFLTTHMKQIGLSHTTITWINSVLPLTNLVGPPVAGYLADHLGHYRLITVTSMILAGVFHTSLLWVPAISGLTNSLPLVQFECSSEGSRIYINCPSDCPDYENYVITTFRVSNCQQTCDSPATHQSTSGLLDSTESQLEMDLPVPSSDLCLQDASGALKCILLDGDNFLIFNRSLSLSQLADRGGTSVCMYSQGTFSTESGHYESLVCNVSAPNCRVTCNAEEDLSGNNLLHNNSCNAHNMQVMLWVYFILRALADMFPAILISMLDAVVLKMVDQYDGDFGRQKMWGLFAVGTFAPLVGFLVDKVSGPGIYGYAPVFCVFDVLMLLTAAIMFTLPFEGKVKKESLLKNLSSLICTTKLPLLLFVVVILGSFWGYLETFLYVYLLSLNAPNFLLGFAITIRILPSLPFLYKSDTIVGICGHHYLLILAFIGYCIRFAGLSFITEPWWVLPLEALELFTINLMQVSAAKLMYKIASKTLVATAQSLVMISHFHIGRSIGTFVGGILIEAYGMVRVFQGASVFAAFCSIVYLALHQAAKKCKARESYRSPPEQQLTQKENGAIANGHYRPLQVADSRF